MEPLRKNWARNTKTEKRKKKKKKRPIARGLP